MTNNTRFVCALFSMLLPIATQASIENTNEANWKPIVSFAGNGDKTTALQRLREIDHLQSTMVNNTRYDDKTESFIVEMWDLIESFNLEKLHETLPVRNQDWNQLSLKGERQNDEYNITMTHQKSLSNIQVSDFGDSYLMFKTQEVTSSKGRTHYIIDNSIKTGFGAQSWQSAREASNDTIQLLSFMGENATPTTGAFKDKVQSLSTQLGTSDIDVLASAWSSFPNAWGFMASIGHIDDIIIEEKSSENIKHLNLSFSLDQDKTDDQYPALTAYLGRLKNLMEASFEVSNEHGRLLKISVDSTTMTARIELVAGKEGIYPVQDDEPVLEHIHKFADKPVTLVGVMNSNIEILGVKTRISNLTSSIEYIPHADSARVEMRINKAPYISIGGAALGFIPTPMVDLFMPSNLKEVISEFFLVACNGNNGEGIMTDLEIKNIHGNNSPGFTQLSATTRIETFSNLFVRVGMNIVNSRLIPSTDASKEIDAFIDNARKAFNSDVDRYEESLSTNQSNQSIVLNTFQH